MKLVDVYKHDGAGRILYRLILERAKEDDPFISWAERAAPSLDRYRKIIASRPYHKWFLIKIGRACAGVVLILKNNEIGIILFQRYRSQGIGAKAIALLLETEKPQPKIAGGKFRARIHPENFRSIKLFKSLGFHHAYNIYELRK